MFNMWRSIDVRDSNSGAGLCQTYLRPVKSGGSYAVTRAESTYAAVLLESNHRFHAERVTDEVT